MPFGSEDNRLWNVIQVNPPSLRCGATGRRISNLRLKSYIRVNSSPFAVEVPIRVRSRPDLVFVMLARVLTEKLFSAEEFRFSLGIGSVEPADFLRNVEGEQMLELRRQALDSSPNDYLGLIRDEAIWLAVQDFVQGLEPGADATSIDTLGRSWEVDFVILDRAAPHQVQGGCVCFPSGWSLPEKIGKSLFLTHAPVPGLNDDLGANISKLLSRIDSGQFIQRTNWGVTGSAELDQHPRHEIPAITASVDPRRVYLRIEWQVLTAISAVALLFGIRVFHVPVEEVRASPELAMRLARNLETMPEVVARYKRLDQCREVLVKYLRG